MRGIEFHPTSKSCPMICKHCTMHDNKIINSNKPDENVQNSFDGVQALIGNHKPWSFQYAYRLSNAITHQLPNIKHLNSLTSVTIGFGPILSIHHENTEQILNDLLKKIDFLLIDISQYNKTHTPKKLIFNFATKNFYLDDYEKEFILLFIDKFKHFCIQNKYGNVHISLGDNLVSMKMLEDKFDIMAENEMKALKNDLKVNYYEKNIIHSYFSAIKKDETGNVTGIYTLSKSIDGFDIIIGKRVIAQKNPSTEIYKERAIKVLQNKPEYLGIFPQGIFINHASINLKNPFLWSTHEQLNNMINYNQKIDAFNNDILTNVLSEIIYKNFGKVSENGIIKDDKLAMILNSVSR